MAYKSAFVLFVLCTVPCIVSSLSAADFGKPFAWGTATASYQVEGAWQADGKGLSIWDVFSHIPGKVADNDTGDTADGSYYLYPQDIVLMKNVGFSHARMSLAWARLFPTGRPPVNPLGIAHYNQVINTLLQNGITPFVTLYHWDLPQGLEDQGGWLNETIVDAFATYADLCFSTFGDRVKYWQTFNEPISITVGAYQDGGLAPGRCSNRSVCTAGNSTTEPYIVGHNILNAHAKAVNILRTKYAHQNAQIGITLNTDWAEPYSNSSEDVTAAQRHMEFQLAWFADPIFFGDYPQSMRDRCGPFLPQFTDAQKTLLKGSHDFFALNHYTSEWVQESAQPQEGYEWRQADNVVQYRVRDGVQIGPQAASDWLYVVPWGIQKAMKWIADRYGNPPLYITENGCDVPNESYMPIDQALNDTFRVNYYSSYLQYVYAAKQADQVDLRGYFAWSLLDNFEWEDGYTKRFGIHYVDYTSANLTRTPKESAFWWKNFLSAPA